MDRQRIMILFAAAAVMAALLSWFLYAKTVAPQEEERTAVMAAAHDLAVGQMVRKADLKKVHVLAARSSRRRRLHRRRTRWIAPCCIP